MASSIVLPYMAVGVTALHVGIGRSPGSVDLPIARDGFGLPYIPSSALKGSVKSLCLRTRDSRSCERLYGWDIRVREEAPEEAWMSPVSFTDGLLLLYPVRVEDNTGVSFAYATSTLQVARLGSLLEEYRCCFSNLLKKLREPQPLPEEKEVLFNNVPVSPLGHVEGSILQSIGLDSLPLPSHLLQRGIYVLDDSSFLDVVEAGIIRQTRVALDYRRKTVQNGHLWSEEYVPEAAVFFSLYVIHDGIPGAVPASNACGEHLALMEETGYLLQVGGKETIGKGFLRIIFPGEVPQPCLMKTIS